jgi:hypothetical protein
MYPTDKLREMVKRENCNIHSRKVEGICVSCYFMHRLIEVASSKYEKEFGKVKVKAVGA